MTWNVSSNQQIFLFLTGNVLNFCRSYEIATCIHAVYITLHVMSYNAVKMHKCWFRLKHCRQNAAAAHSETKNSNVFTDPESMILFYLFRKRITAILGVWAGVMYENVAPFISCCLKNASVLMMSHGQLSDFLMAAEQRFLGGWRCDLLGLKCSSHGPDNLYSLRSPAAKSSPAEWSTSGFDLCWPAELCYPWSFNLSQSH